MDDDDILSSSGGARISGGTRSGGCSGGGSGGSCGGGGRGRSRRTAKIVPRATTPPLATIHIPKTGRVRLFPMCTPVPTTSSASTTFCYAITACREITLIMIRSAVRGLLS